MYQLSNVMEGVCSARLAVSSGSEGWDPVGSSAAVVVDSSNRAGTVIPLLLGYQEQM